MQTVMIQIGAHLINVLINDNVLTTQRRYLTRRYN